jgi:hypothetical protein
MLFEALRLMTITGVSGPLAALPPELLALLEGPSIMHLGTRDAALQPMSAFAFGLKIDGDGREVTVFLPETIAARMLANLRDNGQMALAVVRPTDNRAVQIKGTWLGERRTDETDRAFVESYRDALTTELGLVGVPRSIWRRMIWWPSLALRMEVREVFVQTPGPKAGQACGPQAAPPQAGRA